MLAGFVDTRWDVGREYGTIGARVGDWLLAEITTYRADAYASSRASRR